MTYAQWTDRLAPSNLVHLLFRLTASGFAAEMSGAPVLLIRLRQGQEELGAGLESILTGAPRLPARPLGNLGFHTEIADERHLPELSPQPGSQALSTAELSRELAVGMHYVTPLSKRRGVESAFAERISVGRAVNTDLVLRDKTVSKYHAYFQLDEANTYYLVDAGSKNGTTLNGTTIAPRESVQLKLGDRIVFGSVETVIADPAVLWRAVHTS